MGMKATWTTICDSCSKTKRFTVPFNAMTLQGRLDPEALSGIPFHDIEPGKVMVHSFASGIWAPGLPDGWGQVPREGKEPGLLCCYDCMRAFILTEQGDEALAEFDKSVPTE